MSPENIASGLRNMVDDIEKFGAAPLTVDTALLRQAIAALTPPEGHVVVTRNEAGQAVAVTRQDDYGRILSVIAEFEIPTGCVLVPVEPTDEMQDAYRRKCLDIDLWESLYVPAYKAMIDARPEVP